ncbi:dynamin family protein [Fuchsiella alkaliacetigena]|uniref:dynamin family protein n=1 Tax=Fuchsiella alkaliacetigena TaxID=957042 RepID=UPI00200AEB02|nr:dynamin family protein [Fuchsiella alkaliacetigena]MCK8825255.1 dynamin family protein [Fuchsiella alkaliacetigena]
METKDRLLKILNDELFIDLLLKKNEDQDLKQAIESRKQSLEAGKLYVAVFGIQGAGKSSLLNALVAEDDILPVEADETTCIPVELHKSKNGDRKGEIYYQDGKREEIAVTRDKLDRFVNNEFNPENELEVDHIKIHIPSSFLREDIVFVDLPGVASLREGNQETTLRYIASCTGSIFLLRTVPPITKLEAVLLKMVLPQISHNFFVQNHWTGESQRELENGIEHNKKVLKKVLEQCNLETEINIIAVQIKEAIKGTYMEDKELRKSSGIENLERMLSSSFNNWQEEVFRGIALWLNSHTLEIKEYYVQQKKDLSKDVDEVIENLQKQHEDYQQKRREIEEKFAKLKDNTYKIENRAKSEMRNFIKQTQRSELDKLIAKISQGIYDGDYLKRSVEDTIKEIQGIIAEELQFKLEDLTIEILEDFKDIIEDMSDYKRNMTDGDRAVEIEALKVEKVLPGAGGVLGFLGGKAAGAKAAALVAAAFSPAGWVVGGIAIAGAVLGSILGKKLGSKGKKEIEKRRISKARRMAKKSVKNACKKISKSIMTEIDKYINNLVDELEKALKRELDNTENEFKQRIAKLKESKENREKVLEETQLKLNKAKDVLKELDQILV